MIYILYVMSDDTVMNFIKLYDNNLLNYYF